VFGRYATATPTAMDVIGRFNKEAAEPEVEMMKRKFCNAEGENVTEVFTKTWMTERVPKICCHQTAAANSYRDSYFQL
jgi:hypothetical protein